MKRLSLVIMTACVILWAASAMSYETTVVGDIELDGIIAVSTNPAAGIAAAVSSSSSALYIIDLSTLAVTNKIQLPSHPPPLFLKKIIRR